MELDKIIDMFVILMLIEKLKTGGSTSANCCTIKIVKEVIPGTDRAIFDSSVIDTSGFSVSSKVLNISSFSVSIAEEITNTMSVV